MPRAIRDLLGFPAHAGMDPRATPARRWGAVGFPAHAGMDPGQPVEDPDARAASPPTRGWTVSLDRASPPTRGSLPETDHSSGLPRPRGDGPAAFNAMQAEIRASPPTRGWTRPGPSRCQRGLASPPTRGWTPHVPGVARGWTLLARHLHGFPAHAGMDPGEDGALTSAAGLPRPRGDGPRSSRSTVTGATGFPAHAGMDLGRLRQTRRCSKASPPTRGWTPRPS